MFHLTLQYDIRSTTLLGRKQGRNHSKKFQRWCVVYKKRTISMPFWSGAGRISRAFCPKRIYLVPLTTCSSGNQAHAPTDQLTRPPAGTLDCLTRQSTLFCRRPCADLDSRQCPDEVGLPHSGRNTRSILQYPPGSQFCCLRSTPYD